MAPEDGLPAPASASPLRWASTPGRQCLFAVFAAAVLLLAFLGAREICNPDEPRDAEIAREFSAGDWSHPVAPEINGVPFTERPPLFYWMVAGALRAAGGPTDASARLVPALLGILAVAATWLAGESLSGRGGGLLPALLLLGTPYFFLKTRMCLTDVGLLGFTAASLGLFFAAWRRDSPLLAAAAGVAAGLAFLCKGLLGMGIPAVAAGAFLALKRDGGAVLRLRLWLPTLLGLAVAAPWVWALYRARGAEGLHAFFVLQHFGRLGEAADHAKPFWGHVWALWIFLPQTVLLAAGLLPGNRADAPGREAFRAGAAWVLSMLLVLSCIGGKRPVYLLPLLPGAALAAAGVVEAAAAGGLAWRWDRLVRGWVRLLEFASPAFLLPKGRDLRARAAAAALGLAVTTLAWEVLVEARFNGEKSGHALAARLAELSRDRPLLGYRLGESHVGQFAFPLRRRIPVVLDDGELRRAMAAGPGILLVSRDSLDRSPERKRISPESLARLRLVERRDVDRHPYEVYAWE